MTDDLLLVYLDRGQLPEGVTLVLRPKGKYRVPPEPQPPQPPRVLVVPFIMPPEAMLQRCRESIEQHAPAGEKANLLVVTQVFSFLRYNDLGLLTILGGKDVMLEVPFLDEIVMEKTREMAQQDIITFLEARFGDAPGDVVEGIESIDDHAQLRGLARLAASCPSRRSGMSS